MWNIGTRWLRGRTGGAAGFAASSQEPIGLPLALYAYLHPGLWQAFFEGLGCPVVLSGSTDAAMLERVGLVSETEHCLPAKLLDAHMDALIGRVGRVFVPRILSLKRGYIACPKFGALPDAARARFGDRLAVLSVELDENREPLRTSLVRFARALGASGPAARTASERALAAWADACADDEKETAGAGRRYLLAGHPYLVNEPWFSEPVVRGLTRLGARVERMRFDRAPAPDGPLRWDTSAIMRDTLADLDARRYAGVIQLSSFGCGCDSIAERHFREAARERGLPYMLLRLDEHAGEAGMRTRLEAFVDTIGSRLP